MRCFTQWERRSQVSPACIPVPTQSILMKFGYLTGDTLSKWDWPKIEGLHSFKGKLMHSAAYEEGYSLDGKRVAVVGIGSSGVQIIATIAESVEKLYCWIRSPTWITAGFAQKFAGPDGGNFECMTSVFLSMLKTDGKRVDTT